MRVLAAVFTVPLMATGPMTAGGVVASGAPPSGVVAQQTSAAHRATNRGSDRPRLVNRARRAGLSTHHITWGASEVDYNKDGKLDLWISRHFHGADLWRNAGHHYVRVATSAWPHRSSDGLDVDRHDCQWADVDRNGLVDAYCSAGRFLANFVKTGRDNELWLQGPLGRFRDVGTEWGVGDICARGRNVVFIKANDDKYPDLFVGTDLPRRVRDPCNRHPKRYPNENSKVFINTGGHGFHYARAKFDFGPGLGARSAEKLDFDKDGWPDLLSCGGSVGRTTKAGSGPAQPVRLFRNKHGHGFVDVTERMPSVLAHDATVGDINNDHLPDIVFANGRGFFYSLNRGGSFRRPVMIANPAVGLGRAVAVGDADRDGDLDVFGVIRHRKHTNPDDQLYLNDALSFTAVRAPSARGTADEVIAVHPGAGGAQFLVLNGYHSDNNPNIQLLKLVHSRTKGRWVGIGN